MAQRSTVKIISNLLFIFLWTKIVIVILNPPVTEFSTLLFLVFSAMVVMIALGGKRLGGALSLGMGLISLIYLPFVLLGLGNPKLSAKEIFLLTILGLLSYVSSNEEIINKVINAVRRNG